MRLYERLCIHKQSVCHCCDGDPSRKQDAIRCCGLSLRTLTIVAHFRENGEAAQGAILEKQSAKTANQKIKKIWRAY
jgi:hypothetical protein